MPNINCNVRADVDFGRGPVELWCTETGEGHQHMCKVVFEMAEKIPGEVGYKPHSIFDNIFDEAGPEASHQRRR